MAYIVSDIIFGQGANATNAFGGVYTKLARRDDILTNPLLAADWIKKTVFELTENFPFQELQTTAPIYTLTPGQSVYNYTDILGPNALLPNLIPSFFMFYNNTMTSGIGLKFKKIDSLELMMQTQGTPAYWSRFGNQLYIAPTPIQPFNVRVRYQYAHPFPLLVASEPLTDNLSDPIMMPDSWMDIVEFGAAERGAIDLRMLDYASEFHAKIFGDPEFERTSGAKGNPGLIFRRTSKMEADLTSQMRSIRVQR